MKVTFEGSQQTRNGRGKRLIRSFGGNQAHAVGCTKSENRNRKEEKKIEKGRKSWTREPCTAQKRKGPFEREEGGAMATGTDRRGLGGSVQKKMGRPNTAIQKKKGVA